MTLLLNKPLSVLGLIAVISIASVAFVATASAATSVTYIVALDGSGDFTDIQAAIDAVPSTSTGTIIIKSGIYDLNPQYTYPFKSIVLRSNIILQGEGSANTIIRSFPDKQPFGAVVRAPTVLSKSAIENVTIEDLTIIQNGTPDNLGWNGIDLRGGLSKNTLIRNVKIRDVTGAGISVPLFANLEIANADVEITWTGMTIGAGANCLIKDSRVANTEGDGIFPGASRVTNLTIVNCIVENAGDTGLDIASPKGLLPHDGVILEGNTIRNSHIRVTNAINVLIKGNIFEGDANTYCDVDSGQGRAINVTVEGNSFSTSGKAAIWFLGAQDCKAINNFIQMTTPAVTQSGIFAAIYGTGLIEGNTILSPKHYGISFAGWGLGGSQQVTIRNNKIIDFGSIGIWDDNLRQGPVVIENNLLWDRNTPFVSKYGIRTDYVANAWIIKYNNVYAGSIAAISAPSSTLIGNTFTKPLVQYGLLVDVRGSGSTNPTGTHLYDVGTVVTIQAIADSDWMLTHWLLNGSDVGSSNPISLNMTQNYNLTAIFAEKPSSDPSYIFVDGFDGGGFSAWDGTVKSGTGAVVVDSLKRYEGGYSSRSSWSTSGSTAYATKTFAAVDVAYVRLYVNFAALPQYGALTRFLAVMNGGSEVGQVGVQRSSSGNVYWSIRYLNNGVNVAGVAVSPAVAGDWHCIEFMVDCSSADGVLDGSYRLYVDGVEVWRVLGVDTDFAQVNVIRAGSVSTTDAKSNSLNVDSVVVDDAYIGTGSGTVPVQYQLTIGVYDLGTTNPVPGVYWYDEGSVVLVTAVPDSGFNLARWLLDGEDVGSVNPYSVVMDADHNLTAVFVPTVVFADGFDSGGFSAWSGTVTGGSGAIVADSLKNYEGGYSSRSSWSTSGSSAYATETFSALNLVYVRLYVNLAALPQLSSLTRFLAVMNGGGEVAQLGVQRGSGGEVWWSIRYLNNGIKVASDVDSPVAAGAWRCVEFMVDCSSANGVANGNYRLYVDGVEIWNVLNVDTDAAQVDTIRAGLVSTTDSKSNSLNVDSVVVAEMYVGPSATVHVYYQLTVGVSGSGSTNPVPGTYLFDGGSVVAVEASAGSGYAFTRWLLNGSDMGSVNPYVVTMSQNYNLTAVFVPTVVFADGFDSGGFSAWSGTVTGGSGAVAVDSLKNYEGGYSSRSSWSTSGSSAYATETFAAENLVYVRLYVNFAALPQFSTLTRFLAVMNGGGEVAQLGVQRSSAGNVYWSIRYCDNGVNVAGVGDSPAVADSWICVEFMVDCSSADGVSDGSYRLFVNGVEIWSVVGVDTDSAQVDTIRAGLVSTNDAKSNSLNIDSIVVDDTYIGAVG